MITSGALASTRLNFAKPCLSSFTLFFTFCVVKKFLTSLRDIDPCGKACDLFQMLFSHLFQTSRNFNFRKARFRYFQKNIKNNKISVLNLDPTSHLLGNILLRTNVKRFEICGFLSLAVRLRYNIQENNNNKINYVRFLLVKWKFSYQFNSSSFSKQFSEILAEGIF